MTDSAEAARLVNEGFVPLVRQVSGFVAYCWIEAADGVIVSTSVFQDQAGAEEPIPPRPSWDRIVRAAGFGYFPNAWRNSATISSDVPFAPHTGTTPFSAATM